MKKLALVLCVCLLSAVRSAGSADEVAAMAGYSQAAARVERDWEQKFCAVPATDNLREYMRRLSAHPHHLGSPYDKENAEWILAKFKEWGWDAHIESFDVLFPTPRERVVELV